ncbi:MAG: hypothetical protein ABSE43_07850, partial [Steroidobacteraceae bacterium]
ARSLFTIFGLGYAAVFTVFTLLYLHAWSLRAQLALTPLEALRTRVSVSNEIAMVVIGLLSAALAKLLPDREVGLTGFTYILVPIYFTIAGSLTGRRERALQSQPPD